MPRPHVLGPLAKGMPTRQVQNTPLCNGVRLQVKQGVAVHPAASDLSHFQWRNTSVHGVGQEHNGVHVWGVPLRNGRGRMAGQRSEDEKVSWGQTGTRWGQHLGRIL